MVDFVFAFHSGFRYMVLLMATVTAMTAVAALAGGPASRVAGSAARLYRVFVISVDIQVLLGLVVLFTREFKPVYIGHLAMMLIALAVAHGVSVVMRRRPPERRTAGPLLLGSALALVLIAGGIMAIGRPIL